MAADPQDILGSRQHHGFRECARRFRFVIPLVASLLLAGAPQPSSAQTAAEPAPDFVRDIQPIFARSCYACHGPEQQMGELRLDSKQIAFEGGVSHGVIKPGDPEHSPLYQRIAALTAQPRMPMGGELPAAEVELIARWIRQGAAWPDDASVAAVPVAKHWAFIAPERPTPPDVTGDWAKNPIDHFVQARLEKENLQPSPEADKVTLLRRVSLDLIGLPPSVEEIDAFLADHSPNAYEKQVDRLLNSPHYGERWGRLWLDAARYADSDGFEKDKRRQVWFYRDWVIKALNRDMPYNQFIIDQIAGDLLPHPTQDDLVATGFLRNSMINEEGGINPEQFRMEAMYDRMDAIGKGILGLTIQCAQCHNHKFDPLKQEEYYRLFAFLNNSYEANIAVYAPDEQAKRDGIFHGIAKIEAELQRQTPDWRSRMDAWEQEAKQDQPEWTVIRPEVLEISNGGQKYRPLEDGSFLAEGYAPTKHRVQLDLKTDVQNITAFRLELLNHPNLPLGGPGRSIYGTGALTEFEVEAAAASAPDKKEKLKIAEATADINLPESELQAPYLDKSGKRRVTGPIEYAIDGDELTAWGIDAGPGRRNQPRKAVFRLEQPIANSAGTVLSIYLSQKHGGWNSDDNENNNLGRIRLSITTSPNAKADPLPSEVREILSIDAAQRTPEQVRKVFSYWRTTVPEWNEANTRIEELWKQYPEGSTQLVLDEREQRRPTHILERGDYLKPKKEVTPGVPAFLPPLPENAPVNRLTFARWLVDRKSPTTARSIVNRLWQAYFGIGIVDTPEDFGTRSSPPSHPELLDWLAVEFMDNGWSLKHIQRLIATSEVYRQSSRVTPEMLERDPYNKLLAHGPRYRVDAEIVRDIALEVSGLLNPAVGGPSVFPPAPDFLFQPPVSYGPKLWKTETGPERYRRALYTFRYRSVPYPMLQTFDAPPGEAACVRRSRSNTPLQALTTLNEPLFLEAARALAFKTIEKGGDDAANRLAYAFRRCLSRVPNQAESSELLGLLARQEKRYAAGDLNPWDMLEANPAFQGHLPGDATPAEAAAWTVVSRVLLNLDETITKE
jgi:mono/diheme cytochrome c family protein